MLIYVKLHAWWMVAAVILGCYPGWSGLVRATQRAEDHRSPLPGRFRLRRHVALGTIFYIMIFLGAIGGWAVHEYALGEKSLFPDGLGSLHLGFAIAIVALYAAGWWVGGDMTRNPAGPARARPRAHMVLNYVACAIAGAQIAIAFWALWPAMW